MGTGPIRLLSRHSKVASSCLCGGFSLGWLGHLGPVSHVTSTYWLSRRPLRTVDFFPCKGTKDALDKAAQHPRGESQKSTASFSVHPRERVSRGDFVHWSAWEDERGVVCRWHCPARKTMCPLQLRIPSTY